MTSAKFLKIFDKVRGMIRSWSMRRFASNTATKFLSIDISRSLGHARSKHDARVTGAAADNMQSARSSHRGFIVLRAAAQSCCAPSADKT